MSTPEGEIKFGEPHSWQPSSLIARAAEPPEPPTIGGLLYPAKRTLLSGETESLKTWLALILAKAEMDAGYPVGWADLDAMGAAVLGGRLVKIVLRVRTRGRRIEGGRSRALRALADGPARHGPTCDLDPCPHLQEAIREVLDWRQARMLLSHAQALRAQLEEPRA